MMTGWRALFSNGNGTERADRARDRREWTTAAHLYRELLDKDADQPHIWIQHGHALKESGNLAGAIESYRRALKLDESQSDFHLQLGHALKLAGGKREAEASYLRALELEPESPNVRLELLGMGWTPRQIRSAIRSGNRSESTLDPALFVGLTVVFDVSDLLNYFTNARLPTGIQRVQINIITSVLSTTNAPENVRIACFTPASDTWVEISSQLFMRLADLAIVSGDLDDPSWQAAMTELRCELELGLPFDFPFNAALVNLGTSWWLKNYFLMVREAKAKYGIRYIPFVHDLIPVLAQEHCTPELTKDFISWLLGVFQHADGYIVNSKATAADLAKVAGILGHQPPEAAVVYLDGDCRTETDGPSGRRDRAPSLVRAGLENVPYVLFVSTIESRKNHLMAFNAWLRMVKTRGVRNTPALVCVGNPGWLVDAALSRLESSDLLKQRVRILSKISDDELAALYKNCLFTLYPSSYEGWGLPVTETLCYGKVPLISRVSSLPESGGTFAEYFDLHSESDLLEKLTRLLDDHAYRQRLEG